MSVSDHSVSVLVLYNLKWRFFLSLAFLVTFKFISYLVVSVFRTWTDLSASMDIGPSLFLSLWLFLQTWLLVGVRLSLHILEHMIWFMLMVSSACICTSEHSYLSLVGECTSSRFIALTLEPTIKFAYSLCFVYNFHAKKFSLWYFASKGLFFQPWLWIKIFNQWTLGFNKYHNNLNMFSH